MNDTAHPILDTEDVQLGTTLSQTEIENIPLNGRNFSSLTLFEPGAIATDPTGLTGNNAIERSTYNSDVVSINGNRQQANNYTIEGADNNEPQNNLIAYNIAPDAVGELRVVTGNANATYGNGNGGTIVAAIKSPARTASTARPTNSSKARSSTPTPGATTSRPTPRTPTRRIFLAAPLVDRSSRTNFSSSATSKAFAGTPAATAADACSRPRCWPATFRLSRLPACSSTTAKTTSRPTRTTRSQ